MKNSASKSQAWLAGLAVIIGSVLLLFLIAYFIGLFRASDANVQASIIAGLFAFGGATFSWSSQRRKEELDRHKEVKVKIYEELISFIFDFLKLDKLEGSKKVDSYLQSEEFLNKTWALGKNLILWASPGVIRAYYEAFKSLPAIEAGEPMDMLGRMDKLYHEIRKDLGLLNKGLKKLDLIGIMINDIEEHR
ncbi:MAG: hypothetical protein GXP04_13060 [Alphaproteobacteria bacterium]|nr:hypothetical protein [Alphaproteobacteria bacterium]